MSEAEVARLNEELARSQAEYAALPKAPCGHPTEETDGYGCMMCHHEASLKRNAPRIRAWLNQRRVAR